MRLTETRCPRCDALVPGDAAWCSLCYADLRAPSEPAPADVAPEPARPGAAAPSVAPAPPGEADEPGRTTGHGPAATPDGEPDSEPEGPHPADAMLAVLAAQSADPLRGLSGRFGSTGARVGLGVSVLVATIVLVLAVLTIVGLLF